MSAQPIASSPAMPESPRTNAARETIQAAFVRRSNSATEKAAAVVARDFIQGKFEQQFCGSDVPPSALRAFDDAFADDFARAKNRILGEIAISDVEMHATMAPVISELMAGYQGVRADGVPHDTSVGWILGDHGPLEERVAQFYAAQVQIGKITTSQEGWSPEHTGDSSEDESMSDGEGARAHASTADLDYGFSTQALDAFGQSAPSDHGSAAAGAAPHAAAATRRENSPDDDTFLDCDETMREVLEPQWAAAGPTVSPPLTAANIDANLAAILRGDGRPSSAEPAAVAAHFWGEEPTTPRGSQSISFGEDWKGLASPGSVSNAPQQAPHQADTVQFAVPVPGLRLP